MKPQLSGNMLPNIKMCEKWMVEFFIKFENHGIKIGLSELDLHHQIYQFTLI